MNKQNSQADGEHSAEEEIIEKPAAPAIEENDDDEDEDMSEYGVPAMPTKEEESEEESEEKSEEEAPENGATETEEELDLPAIQAPEARPTRLDTRVAQLYIRKLHMLGEENIPTEEQLLADLKKYSKEQKIDAMHFHRLEIKKISGDTSGDELDVEDIEAIKDAERESIRQEIITEQHQIQVQTEFVEFLDKHPELLKEKKEYDPRLAKAVETLWKGGMPLPEAYATVTESISSVKADEGKEAAKRKQKLLSGSVSASNDFSKGAKAMTWTEFDKLRTSDPARYEKLLDEGYEPSDE